MGHFEFPPGGFGSGGLDNQARVFQTLRAMGGEGTLGDIVALVGLSRADVENSLVMLIALGKGHVRVSGSGEQIYHLGEDPAAVQSPRAGIQAPEAGIRAFAGGILERMSDWRGSSVIGEHRRIWFDRKTLRLIRAREGVLSLAELVEHTGLPLVDAQSEMDRLVACYGGEAHAGLDGHVVWAFPELMVSAHGRFSVREPRPAWVRSEDPMRVSSGTRGRENLQVMMNSGGVLASVALAGSWLATAGSALTPLSGLVLFMSAAGALGFGGGLLRGVRNHHRFRFREGHNLRRYALGPVFETALAGKGVVSLDRMVAHLQARAGRPKVKRSSVETALRELAREFDAPITAEGDDLFFGFRNIKRQFLASHLQRNRLKLGTVPSGSTVFDSADSPHAANQRELSLFDLELEGSQDDHGPNLSKSPPSGP